MATINVEAITKAVQELVNKGKITCIGDNLIYHAKDGAYNVGTEEDMISMWNLISAHRSKDGE